MMKKITWSLAIGLFAGMNLNGYSQVLVEDAAFGTEGLVQWGIGDALEHSNEVGQILEQPDGKIIFGGMNESAGSFYFTVARMLEDGTPDNAFGTNGVYNDTSQFPEDQRWLSNRWRSGSVAGRYK